MVYENIARKILDEREEQYEEKVSEDLQGSEGLKKARETYISQVGRNVARLENMKEVDGRHEEIGEDEVEQAKSYLEALDEEDINRRVKENRNEQPTDLKY